MSNQILNDLTNYLDFLRQCGHNVTLSCFGNKFEPYTTNLMDYDVHTHSICTYLKRNKSTVGKCINNKRKLEKLKVDTPYFSCCYAGLEEYVIPVKYKGEFLLYVHVSGFRNNIEKSKHNRRQIEKICDNTFKELYSQLSENAPKLDDVLKFVKPIEYIVIKLYKYCHDNYGNTENLSATKELYLKAMKYIYENYMHEISCESIANNLGYSTSYLRYVFKKEENISVSAKITEIKLLHAMFLLTNSKLNITEISFNCGFCDSNYFSTVFKKNYGIAPKLYRKKYVNKEYGASFE